MAAGPWNVFVEGDNLDVLATLAPGSVDLIYIDPPYNTGNDFAYADDFRDGSGNGSLATRHAAWVRMMRPRLVAAREVLRATGAIYVSIDDNEVAHLRLLLDEVFGEAHFVAQIVVNLNAKGRQLGWGFATSHEYLLVYARDLRACALDATVDLDGERGRLPARDPGRSAVPAPAAAQHEQEVQPRHRRHPALPGVRRPGDRRGPHDAVRRRRRGAPGVRRRHAGGLAVVADRASTRGPTTSSAGP